MCPSYSNIKEEYMFDSRRIQGLVALSISVVAFTALLYAPIGDDSVALAQTNPAGATHPYLAGTQDIEDLSGSATSDDECVEAVSADGIITGSWTSDCASEGRSGSYARYYTFTLVNESEVTVTLESDEDTYLFIREGSGRDGSVLHEHDDIESGADTDSRLSVTLRPDEYTIEATTYATGVTGDFTLTLRGLTGQVTPPPEPTPETPADECLQTVTEDGTLSGSWNSDCRSEGRRGRYARYYSLTLDVAAAVTIILVSDVDTYLFLREGTGRDGAILHENDDNVSAGNTNSRIEEKLVAGSYTIEATTFDSRTTGDFTLTISGLPGEVVPPPEPPEPPAPEPMPEPIAEGCGEALTENGTTAGIWSSQCAAEGRSGSYARYYTLTLEEAREITTSLESNRDAYLFVREGIGRDGTVLHENDDIERNTNTNSLIRETLAAGEYTIEATTYEPEASGDFTITISGLPETVEPPASPTPETMPEPIAEGCGEALSVDGATAGIVEQRVRVRRQERQLRTLLFLRTRDECRSHNQAGVRRGRLPVRS